MFTWSLAISLAIVILITESPTNGFTIRHTKNTTTETVRETDLSIEESLLLEVKTLRTPNDITAIGSKNEGEIKGTIKNKLNGRENTSVGLSDEEIQIASHDRNFTQNDEFLSTPKEHDDKTVNLQITEGSGEFKDVKNNNNEKVKDVHNFIITERISSLGGINKSTIDVSSNIAITETPDDQSIERSSVTTPEAQVITTYLYVSDSSVNDENSTVNSNVTEFIPLNDLTVKESTIYANKENENPHEDSLRVIFNAKYNMTPEASEMVSFKTVAESSNKKNNAENDKKSTTKIQSTAEMKASQEQRHSTTSQGNNTVLAATKTNPTKEFQNIEKKSYVDPSWRKYTVIDRKRGSIKFEDLTTEMEDGMMKAETSQTHISLDKLFTYTPTPSLEKLRDDLLSIAHQSSRNNQEETHINYQSVDNMVGTNSKTSTLMPTKSASTTKIDMVSTKRAGFLDNTGKIAALDVTTPENVNHTKMYKTMLENEALDNGGQQSKNASDVESLSQLAEDAIKEELLKEMTLNDHEESKEKRHRAERTDIKKLTETTTLESSDILNVQPITQDKSKNLSLYTVSPNYKPMKKIDVQPPKQFVRDPDDNSWRNESISSLGIVFKPKNSSKSFTQVLKNKTETEFTNLLDKDKSGVPDLRERLEKIAEVRKSKKKRIDKFGEVVYTDYEESNTSGEVTGASRTETTSTPITFVEIISPTSTTSLSPSSIKPKITTKNIISTESVKINTTMTKVLGIINNKEPDILTTQKPKKLYNIAEYYDTTDEYDADYLHLSKIDLQRFTTPSQTTATPVAPLVETLQTKPMRNYLSDRKPTIQYFPPRKPAKMKVNINDYDDQFQRKVNLYTFKDIPNTSMSPNSGTAPTESVGYDKPEEQNRPNITPAIMYRPGDLNKNLYLTHAPRVTEPNDGFAVNDGNYNKASYVIKHYRDFIDQAAKDDDERSLEYTNTPFTESPMRGVTVNELAKEAPDTSTLDVSYDYDQQFRKDILNRFVDNFNQNSERFKVDFPILYNNSVVHRKFEANGKALASSSAFVKRLYDTATPKPNFLLNKKQCDPNCDSIAVELSPAYELHYYVPEQEEKEEAAPHEGRIPYRFRL